MRIINIKEDKPNVDYAMYLLDEEIKYSKAIGNKVIVVIHGYGSHGQGGAIKLALKSYLPHLKKIKAIDDFVFGENWGELNETRKKICQIAPNVEINENLMNINSGVSVILL